ncbi:serine/threonine protein kinase [Piscinibacter sakaiensis]|uniref:serine/threonine protein kinase n=1 Tax=Piscinibacter sakaiensis TaxID=1547922 RepID=UPI003AB0EF9F
MNQAQTQRQQDPNSAGGDKPPIAPPFTGLTPDTVLDALDAVGLRGDGRLIQLNSYENRVFQVFLEDGRVVVAKFYRPGRWSDAQILEEHAFAAELMADECPVVAPWPLHLQPDAILRGRLCTAASDEAAAEQRPASSTLVEVETTGGPYRFAVVERRAGRAPELETPGRLEWIGRLLGRMHRVGARRAFAARTRLSVDGMGRDSRNWLANSDIVPPDVLPGWLTAADRVIDGVQQAFDRVEPIAGLRLHGDCHVGNILWTDAGPHFVDLDDCMTGPAVQDLWMLLSGDATVARRELNALLSGYEQFMDFDDRELALIEPLRSLRMIHHSAWLARRWDDPAFKAGFPWFDQAGYWAQRTTELHEQAEVMAHPRSG